ncbi:MAG TPA: DUF6600 domain-containing protein [Bryobacteraceae bacterium]|nr:DUF6600 domain-containing protein [Bryobacteraceae bacterium]
MVRRIGFWSTLFVLAALPVLADPGDPPTRVARLNYETGAVSFRPGSIDDWAPATPNYPLTTGDHLWADRGAQAEMHIGSTAVRMNSETALNFLNLDDRTVQLSLTAGTIHVRLRALADDQSFEVDTPNVAVTLLRPGDYRISADGDNAVTFLAVRAGDAELTAGGTAFPVHPRQAARITGTDSVSRDLIDVPPPDAFDAFCQARDRREETSQSVRYVPREMIGYEDLDANGAWREVPPYGWVWAPTRVVVGWAPYRYGHWAWVAPWGWTWVDDAPWGFAPFHYGRWAFAAGGWVWIPGRVVERPVYAPALVAFVGGPHFSLSVSIGGGGGGVAWFPLGPGEVYRPAYHVSDTYVRNVNITHVNVTNINVTNVNVTNVRYVNQNVNGAVTAVPQQAFVSARPVAQVATVVTPQQAAQAQVVGSTAAVAPRPESIVQRQSGTTTPVVRPPAQAMQQTVVAKATPPPPPVSFGAQQQALQANQGRPLDPATLNNVRQSQPRTLQATPQVRPALPRAQVTQAPVALPPANQPPPNPRPVPATAQPVNPPRPAVVTAPPANQTPVNPRPVPAIAQPVNPPKPAIEPPPNPRPTPAAAQPAVTVTQPNNPPRPAVIDRPVRNDRPPSASVQPANPPSSTNVARPNSTPAETTHTTAATPEHKEDKKPQKSDKKPQPKDKEEHKENH